MQGGENKTILGVDAGFDRVGFAVILGKRNAYSLQSYGVIETSRDFPFAKRLFQIKKSIRLLIKKYRPCELAIEEIFFHKNQKTAVKVAHARGVIIATAVEHGVKVFDYTPLVIKQTVCGYGRAEKKQIQYMIEKLFSLKEPVTSDDAADAIACAYTHLTTDKAFVMG